MKKTFFLSHSTKDQEFVIKVAESLGKEKCWLSQWEVKLGDSIFKFDRGIADSRVFVLFWSKNAALSQWVEEEVSQARIRLFRDKGFRLVVIKLDYSLLPDSLAYRVCIDGTKGVAYVVRELQQIEKDLTPKEVFFGKPALKDYFQNRQKELDNLERLAFSEAYSGIMVLGPEGMGKTSLVKRGIPFLFSNLTPIWIDLKVASTPIRLLSSICRPISISIDFEQASANPEDIWHEKLLPEISQSEKIFIVLDNFRTESAIPFLEGQIMKRLLNIICHDLAELNKPQNPNVIIISSMIPEIDPITISKYGQLKLGGLDKNSMIRALRYHLSYTSSLDYDSKKVELLAEKLRGYPLAISLVSMRVAEQGIDIVLEDKSLLRKMLLDIAKELFSGLSISPEEKKMLTLVATSMHPLSADNLRSICGEYWTNIVSLSEKQLLDPTSEGYRLHDILSDYVLESMTTPKEIMETHAKLAMLFKSEWQSAPEMTSASALYGSLSYYHNISAGHVEDAKHIKIAYLEEAKDAAIELYRRKQYKIALTYLENVRKMDKIPDPIYDFYYALSLSRLERPEQSLPILQNLTSQFPKISRYHHALGETLRRLKRYNEALESFRKAVATSSSLQGKAVPMASLASLLCDMGKIKEADPLSKRALEIAPRNSGVVSTAVKILEKSGDIHKALEVLSDALRTFPTNAHLNFRAGMILKQMGQFAEAKNHLEQAVKDPALSFSYTALADVYLLLGNDKKAEEVLEKFPGKKRDNTSYLSIKGNILRCRGEFEKSAIHLKRALNLEPNNPVHHGGLAQLKLDQAKESISKGDKESALIYIKEAKIYLSEGLHIDKNDEALLTIKHSIDEFIFRIGFK